MTDNVTDKVSAKLMADEVLRLSGDLWSGLPETGTVKLPTNEQWLETYERLGLKRLLAQGRQQAEREARLTLSLTL